MNWGESVTNAIKEFFIWLWAVFKEYIGMPIARGISSTIGAFFDGLKDALMAIWKAISAPFYTLAGAWQNTIYQFQQLLGPYSFLTPLLLAVLAIAAFLVVYAIIRYITPGV